MYNFFCFPPLRELAERIDVSYHGSSITAIAGDIGNIIVKDCKSIGELFYNWKRYVHGNLKININLAKIIINQRTHIYLTNYRQGDNASSRNFS